MMNDTIEKVFAVYGDNLPDKVLFNATVKSPVSVKLIDKKFKSWAKFEKEYKAYCIVKRNEAAKAKVVTKNDS